MDAIEALSTRRSPAKLVEPAPSDQELATILGTGMRAPDHGRLRPWRFIVLRGAARERFGDVLADALKARMPETAPDQLQRERQKPLRAPLLVIVAAEYQDGKIMEVEQLLAAGAAAQNLLVAAYALGYGAWWRTGDSAYDSRVKTALGLAPNAAIVGYIYLGTPAGRPLVPPDEPGLEGFVREWSGVPA